METYLDLIWNCIWEVWVNLLESGSHVCRFEDGAQQFRDDAAVNPNDTEEASIS